MLSVLLFITYITAQLTFSNDQMPRFNVKVLILIAEMFSLPLVLVLWHNLNCTEKMTIEYIDVNHHYISSPESSGSWVNLQYRQVPSSVRPSIRPSVGRRPHSSLRKHAYSNILKISPPKPESFQIKILIFSYFCSKHRLWELVRIASSRRF